MKELCASTRNLKLAATANQEIITQNDKLYNLRALYQRLEGELESIERLKSFKLMVYDANGMCHQNEFGEERSIDLNDWLKDTRKYHLLTELIVADGNIASYDEHLRKLMYYSADVIEYLEIGGKHGHIRRQTVHLLAQILPLANFYEKVKCEKRLNTDLKERMNAVAVAARKIERAVDNGEAGVSELIYRE